MLQQFHVLTLFPQFFDSFLSESLVGKGLEKKLFQIQIHALRNWAQDKHRRLDDIPYGGGPGMVLKPEPLVHAIEEVKSKFSNGRVVYLSCQGPLFHQRKARSLLQEYREILFVCGRYEGIDERAIEIAIDEELSIGDYVLFGGEAAAIVVLETLIRLIPGVMGKAESQFEESFEQGLLEYPQYTRPEEFRGLQVPEVLLSGNHAQIRQWRVRQAIAKTARVRPELLERSALPSEIQQEIQKRKGR